MVRGAGVRLRPRGQRRWALRAFRPRGLGRRGLGHLPCRAAGIASMCPMQPERVLTGPGQLVLLADLGPRRILGNLVLGAAPVASTASGPRWIKPWLAGAILGGARNRCGRVCRLGQALGRRCRGQAWTRIAAGVTERGLQDLGEAGGRLGPLRLVRLVRLARGGRGMEQDGRQALHGLAAFFFMGKLGLRVAISVASSAANSGRRRPRTAPASAGRMRRKISEARR